MAAARSGRDARIPLDSVMPVRIRRVYELEGTEAGRRFLVDRIWPRGIRKADLPVDGWLRELAPTDELRKEFGHRPERWDGFQKRYREELREREGEIAELARMAKSGEVWLFYGAKDRERNQAVVLKSVIEAAAGTTLD